LESAAALVSTTQPSELRKKKRKGERKKEPGVKRIFPLFSLSAKARNKYFIDHGVQE
jgi:hypothetical protein